MAIHPTVDAAEDSRDFWFSGALGDKEVTNVATLCASGLQLILQMQEIFKLAPFAAEDTV